MQDLKISLVTVCYNAENTISRCIESVIGQNFKNIEYIVIDGGSNDKTTEIINRYKTDISLFLSEPDEGIYDAMNKGIKMASGHVIGMLNADDYFADNDILTTIARTFNHENTDIIYGDLDYINSRDKIIRKWRSGECSRQVFNWGWMPPHPTFYCKRSLFQDFGFYSLEFGTAADYELMLRFMYHHKADAFYLKKVMIKMSTGGVSNKNMMSRIKAVLFDYKAMRNNDVLIPLITLIFKPLRKIIQYF